MTKCHPIEGYLGAVLAPTFSRITRFDTIFNRFFYIEVWIFIEFSRYIEVYFWGEVM